MQVPTGRKLIQGLGTAPRLWYMKPPPPPSRNYNWLKASLPDLPLLSCGFGSLFRVCCAFVGAGATVQVTNFAARRIQTLTIDVANLQLVGPAELSQVPEVVLTSQSSFTVMPNSRMAILTESTISGPPDSLFGNRGTVTTTAKKVCCAMLCCTVEIQKGGGMAQE